MLLLLLLCIQTLSALNWSNYFRGFRKLLNWIKNTYGNPVLIVTENGFSDTDAEGVNDQRRIEYYRDYTNSMLKAINIDGCNVTKYTAWSLLDNFEWYIKHTCYVYKLCSLVITVLTFYAILYNDTGLKGTLNGLVCILSITLIQLAQELQNLLKLFSNNCLLTTVSQVLVKV